MRAQFFLKRIGVYLTKYGHETGVYLENGRCFDKIWA